MARGAARPVERRRRRLPEPALTAARGSSPGCWAHGSGSSRLCSAGCALSAQLHGLKATSEIVDRDRRSSRRLEMTGAEEL